MSNAEFFLSYPKFKLAILALLTLNIGIYAALDTLTTAVDALVWVILLVMFELETVKASPFNETTLHAIRNGLIVVIALVFGSYVRDNEWLDVSNSLLWFALIVLLELEVRWPSLLARHRRLFWLMTVAVFVGLIGMVVAWLTQSDWLDAYDALLWIAAFGVIEVDIFHFLQLTRD
ncbi:hypothetical protein [Methylomonas albis]|uniref:Diguanylate cyclase n=1 Tax=Methylomonas albis TaxID=1854563 RepID=A0ABR9D4H6_9GAMM|nr:hypothetical protein [Methylomonas albis]MBD9357701.1 hypothetical protein [Methylomonas albis]CAD6881015.1 hypothetical protein [Methylomonas albis]